MATINLGSIKFKWKGTYNGATAYTVDDVVEYNGSSYICILASTGNLPTNATYFEQMSSAGTNGTDGTDLGTTLTTQGDLVYRDASGLARLGAGTSGQVLQTNGTGANPSWGTVATDAVKIYSGTNLGGTGTIDFDNVFTDTYAFYKVHLSETYADANPGSYYALRFINDSGSVISSAEYNFSRVYGYRNTAGSTSVSTPGAENSDLFAIAWNGQNGTGGHLELAIHNSRNSSKQTNAVSYGHWYDGALTWSSGIGGGHLKRNEAHRGFRLLSQAGGTNISVVNVQIYGFKN